MSSLDDAVKNIFAFASGPAIKLILSWLSRPVIAGVSIECTSYKESYASDVSNMPVIAPSGGGTTGKNYLSDNVAPKPIQWDITGFIGSTGMEPSSLSMFIQPSLLIQKNKLINAWLKRKPVEFQPLNRNFDFTSYGTKQRVAISKLEIEARPDVMNKIPVTMTLIQIPYISIVNGKQTTVNSADGSGDTAGSVKDFGAMMASVMK